MSLKKLSINKEEEEMLIELAGKGLSSYKIAKKLKKSQKTAWRNLHFLGLNTPRKTTTTNEPKEDVFNWKDFNNILI